MVFLDNSSEEEHSQETWTETKTWLESVLVVFPASLELCHPSQMTLLELVPCSNICVNSLLIDLNNWKKLQEVIYNSSLYPYHICFHFFSITSIFDRSKQDRGKPWQKRVKGALLASRGNCKDATCFSIFK